MKSSEKRWKPDRTNSVVTSLMGFNELHPQPSIHEKRRGLSKSYLRNSASIALRPGSLISVSRSCSTNRKNDTPTSNRLVNSRGISERKGIRSSRTISGPVSSSLFRASYGSRKSVGRNDEYCVKHVLRCQQKLEHDSLHRGNLQPELTCKELPLKSTFSPKETCISYGRSMNRIPPHRSYIHFSQSLLGKSSLANESKKQNLHSWKGKKVQEFGVSGRNQTLSQRLALADRISKPWNLDGKFCKTDSCSPTSLLSRSSDSSTSSVHSNTDVGDGKSLKGVRVSESESVKDILSPNALEIKSNNGETSEEDVLESESGKRFQTSLGVNETMSPDSKVSELSGCSFSCFGSTLSDPERHILGIRNEMDNGFENDSHKGYEPSARVKVSSRSNGDPVDSESNHGCSLEEGAEPSSVEEVFSRETSMNEESSPYSNLSKMVYPESMETLKRTNQHSPNSVLESFSVDNSSIECFDGIGLRLQIESLNFESEESYTEGSVMYVSGDEDGQKQFGNLSHDSRKVRSWLGDGQSRNFSYVVDVLDEAGFCCTNSYMDFKMWDSLECPISPSVFEALENKYGKQTSWPKSERQLLFDRINSELLEIFNPVINFPASTSSVHRTFSASFRLDEVVDELWMKLISQEKEKSKDLFKKSMEKWFEFEEGIDIICRELENSLLAELAMEFASLWD